LLTCDIDLNEFLPRTTIWWCELKLAELGINASQLSAGDALTNGDRVHQLAYESLRIAVNEHISAGNSAGLGECLRPTGAGNWRPVTNAGEEIRAANEMIDEGDTDMEFAAEDEMISELQDQG